MYPRDPIYGFIGPNGSGKTTTIRMIMNIILPDRGQIRVLGRATSSAARDEVGTTIVFSTHDMAAAERLCDRIFMIFRGHKVLDGSLEEIQARHAHDTVRLRLDGGADALAGFDEIESINDHGNYQDVRLRGQPQPFLQKLVMRATVRHFEIAKPSLHDIFVRIARPTADEIGMPQEAAR
jgi:ABC-type uncharacterized transport system ATPase subunit